MSIKFLTEQKSFIATLRLTLNLKLQSTIGKQLPGFLQFLETLPDLPFYLSDIIPQVLDDFKIKRLRKGKAKKTVNNELSTLHRYFNLAIQREHLQVNPMQKVEFLRLTDRKTPRFPTKEELKRIYSELSGQDKDIIKILANTDMR